MISQADTLLLTEQLGREPRGAVAIPVKHRAIPLVVQVRSWVGQQPFPTLYWLSSKSIGKAISSLEAKGLVKTLEALLQEDQTLREGHLQDQQRYIEQRWQLMLPEDKQIIENAGFIERFNNTGIGGIEQLDKIRCLHMQYAYHLVSGSTIGHWLDEHYQLNKIDIKR